MSRPRILCISNGHGEDSIAIAVLRALRDYPVELVALPIVGTGEAYRQGEIPIVGPTLAMPSGGFIYMDARQLWRDIQQGLGRLTLRQVRAVQAIAPEVDLVLAVGDIVVQVFAWLSQRPYVFIGTAKSDYYLGGKPSVFAPWERWFMQQPKCEAVYPRDRITTLNLQKLGVSRAYDLGNPMMDGLSPKGLIWEDLGWSPAHRVVALLPGSRPPEAFRNLGQLLAAVAHLGNQSSPLVYVAALASALRGEVLEQTLAAQGWLYTQSEEQLAWVEHKEPGVYLVWGRFADCIQKAHLVLAMTGTATEQAVGLGKPVIIFPGEGPQFTYRFAEAQTRLLGTSVTLLEKIDNLPETAHRLLTDADYLKRIAANGRERMGSQGAAQRIAAHIMERFSGQVG